MTPVVLLTAALAVAAPAVKEKPPAATTEPTGVWEMTSAVVNGRPTPSRLQTYEFTADGRWLTFQDGRELVSAVERRVDFDLKAAPATIDLYGKGTTPANRFRGIFKVEKEALTICFRYGERPTAFESPVGSEQSLFVFKRVKEGGRP